MKGQELRAGEQGNQVVVGSRILASAGARIKESLQGGRCALLTDANAGACYANILLGSLTSADFRPALITVSPGEKSKSLEQAGAICNQMTAAGLDRSSFVIALGGGVVGDLAGFVAAIYHRGIPHVQIPTTLLAQVDSSIGGKTGVNTVAGKNLIGAIHHPALVIADVDTLKTLPEREFRQGFAEIIKHAIIAEPSLFDMLGSLDRGNLAPLVRRNVQIKASIVAADDCDVNGQRALLNFGHTVGHAVEHAAGYGALLHGEAISLGIVAACEISVRKAGLPEAQRSQVMAALAAFELPTRLPAGFARDKILEALLLDKKFVNGQVRFVVTPALGSARLASDVTIEDIRAAIARL